MKGYPTVSVEGGERTLKGRSEVRSFFEQRSGFEVGEQVEEYTVDAIDCELDYITSDAYEGHELRAYVYLDPVTPEGDSATIGNSDLHVRGWVRDSFMTDDNGQFGVVYTLRPDEEI